MKNKISTNNYQIRDINCQPVIVIIYDEYIFFANNRKTHK